MALCRTSGMCVPPGTSILALAGIAAGAVAFVGAAGAADVCAPSDGWGVPDGFGTGLLGAGAGATGPVGKGPSCCAKTAPAPAGNNKTAIPANRKMNQRFVIGCPPASSDEIQYKRCRLSPQGCTKHTPCANAVTTLSSRPYLTGVFAFQPCTVRHPRIWLNLAAAILI